MLRTAGATIARRAILNSSKRNIPKCSYPPVATFHASSRSEEEAKVDVAIEAPTEESKGGLFGTGLSEWFALPIGITAAVPILKFDWYVVNEETQLAAVFIAFCVALYSQGGDVIYNSLNERAETLLKEHNEVEDKVIAALEQKLEFLKANQNMVDDFTAMNTIREDSYTKLNAAGAIKPQHDFKAQVERVLGMIVAEEAAVTEKSKTALMEEATATVSEKFMSDKALRKSALDAAIATIKGNTKEDAVDPVRAAFTQFFKEKTAALEKADDGSEEEAQRAALIAKINSVAQNESFFFELDNSGKPVMSES